MRDSLDIMNTDVGPVEITGAAKMLRDEVIGKLVHSNIMVSMSSVGFTPVALGAMPKEDGSLMVFYAVRLSADELTDLPSIYDPLIPPVKRVRKKQSRPRKAGKMAIQHDGSRIYRRPK